MANRPAKPKKSTAAKNQPKVARGNHAGWIALLIAASACMFVLGVLVGRNSSPVHFNMDTLENLEPSVLAADNSKPEVKEEPVMPEEIPFEFYEELKKKPDIDEYAQGRPRVLAPKYEKPKASEIRIARAERTSSPKPSTVKTTEAAKPEKPAETPAVEARTESGPKVKSPEPAATKPAPSTQKRYAIQVASLRDPERAETVRQKFRAKGYPAFTQVATVEGKGQWCRVRIGPYPERSQAENDLSRLQNAGVDAMLFSISADDQ